MECRVVLVTEHIQEAQVNRRDADESWFLFCITKQDREEDRDF